jgi:serine/threonine-protein kinase
MTATLSAVHVSTDTEIKRIGQSLTYAAQKLSTTGLTGAQTDAILNALTANSSYIINSATENLQNRIVAAEPANWSYIEGRNVGEQTYLNPNPNGEITPVMTPLVAVQSDMMANIITAPIFNGDEELIGTVSVIFDPAKLLNHTVTTALSETAYTMTVMQTDGLMIFDTDPLQLYKNMFTDPAYANYTQLLLLGHHVADYSSGYGSYKFTVDAASTIVVNKDCYWTTVYAYGQEWRIVLQHS